jgi:hypothetical protein
MRWAEDVAYMIQKTDDYRVLVGIIKKEVSWISWTDVGRNYWFLKKECCF